MHLTVDTVVYLISTIIPYTTMKYIQVTSSSSTKLIIQRQSKLGMQDNFSVTTNT